MLYLSENLKKFRLLKNLTQEDVAEYLGITPQSVSKWERAECYPDITFLPALANIFETSVDMLLGTVVIHFSRKLEPQQQFSATTNLILNYYFDLKKEPLV